jgi:hypothetical protein
VQFQAVAALRGLSMQSHIRLQIVRAGALEPLILAAGSDSVEVQREVAATLANLTMVRSLPVCQFAVCWGEFSFECAHPERLFDCLSLLAGGCFCLVSYACVFVCLCVRVFACVCVVFVRIRFRRPMTTNPAHTLSHTHTAAG